MRARIASLIRRRPVISGAIVLLALTLAMFGDVILAGNRIILGRVTEDMAQADALWRMLAFPALKHGHILLWNKFEFSGTPFFTESQMAVLYPFNWLHLIMPLAVSINLIVAIHVFLTGFWMFLWARRRGMKWVSSLYCGIVLMFSGPFFAHVWAGHMNNLAAMSWVPLLLIAADMLLASQFASGILIGSAALAMQLLAGQPQYSYYTLITLALYMIVNLAGKRGTALRLRSAVAMVTIGAAALAIAAVQILPVALQSAESSRVAAGTTKSFAGSLSFPPENILTALAPTFFGDMRVVAYWGRWKFWEMCLYVGVTAVVLAAYAIVGSTAPARKHMILLAAILGVLALGSYTPVYALLFNYFPGFSTFRGTSKFAFDAIIFIVLLAGLGLDALLEDGNKTRNLAIAAAIGAVLCGTGAVSLGGGGADGVSGPIGSLVNAIHSTGETYLDGDTTADPNFVAKAANVTGMSLYAAAFLLGVNALLLWLRIKSRRVVYVIAALGALEVIAFSAYFRATFPAKALYNPMLQSYMRRNLDDGRILLTRDPNQVLAMRIPAIWGYDSFNLNRYTEFIAYATGGDPDNFESKTYPQFRPSPLLALLRLKYISDGVHIEPAASSAQRFPHISLMEHSVVIPQRNAIFAAMTSGTIDLTKTVILESPPSPDVASSSEQGTGPIGTIHLVRDNGDSMEITGDIARPCTLLITDAYAAGWHAHPLGGSVQQAYRVTPADYTLRGIGLKPGHQHFMVAFEPAGLAAGKKISVTALVIYICAVSWFLIDRRCRPGGDTPA